MRLGIVFLAKGGGCSHYAYELAKTMADRVDVTCYITTQNTMLSDFRSLDCRTRAFTIKRGAKSLLFSMLSGREESGIAKAILDDSQDIIIDAGSGGWGQVVQKQLGGRIPIAQVVHDVNRHPGRRAFIDSLPGLIRPSVSDVYIGLSEYSYKQLVRKYPHKKCISSKHGIILPSNNIDVDAVASRRHKQLFFGRIDPYKGLHVLVDAFGIAKNQCSAIELDIVGRGTIKPKLLQRIRGLNIGLVNRYVSDDEVGQIISSHGVMILPYTSATQSGVAAIAIGNGMPCVATSVGALPEQVQHGRNGLIVPPRDPRALAAAMVEISSTAMVAKNMTKESIRMGKETYSWQRIGSDMLADIDRFLHSN